MPSLNLPATGSGPASPGPTTSGPAPAGLAGPSDLEAGPPRRDDRALLGVLVEAQERGFLGPGPVVEHVEHARRLTPSLPHEGVGVDLGSGGGVPGLVMALDRPGIAWTFVESNLRRAVWLGQAIDWLGLTNVVVRNERAEVTGRSPLRGTADLVTARSFAAPAITAECAAPLLRVGGLLWVSQPPVPDPGRWPAAGLAQLGLSAGDNGVRSWAAFVAETPCGARYPRRVGIPGKRPLF